MYARTLLLAGCRRHLKSTGAFILAVLTYTACSLGPELCDTGVSPAIEVVIVDAVTGEPLAVDAVAVVRSGAFADTLVPSRRDGMGRVISHASTNTGLGTYDVRVSHAGYEPWLQSNVRVRAGECGIETLTLTAELVPSSAP